MLPCLMSDVLMKEKVNEASLCRSVCQFRKACGTAFAAMKRSQTAHCLAVSNHEKMQSQLKEKLVAVGVFFEAWEKTKQNDSVHMEVLLGEDAKNGAGLDVGVGAGASCAGVGAASAGVSGASAAGGDTVLGVDGGSGASTAGSDRVLCADGGW